MMKTSALGQAAIRERESLKLKAYQDGGGVWTIGYGHTLGVKDGDVITEAQANAFLMFDLIRFENAVNKHLTVTLIQCEFDALVSFAFNCGIAAADPVTCTAVRKLNQGDRRGFARNLARWNQDNGKYVEGLAMRRSDELFQFLGGTP